MTRILAVLLIIFMNDTSAFTISLVPLLTRLGPFGNHYVNQFSQMSPSSPPPVLVSSLEEVDEVMGSSSDTVVAPKKSATVIINKPTTKKFKFEYTDAHMISDYKSEIMEYVYAKSLDRGFA